MVVKTSYPRVRKKYTLYGGICYVLIMQFIENHVISFQILQYPGYIAKCNKNTKWNKLFNTELLFYISKLIQIDYALGQV